MAPYREPSPDQAAYLDELVGAGHLIPSGVPGVYGRGATFEAVREALAARIRRAAADDGAETLRFPPILPRHQLESLEYLKSFPHLAGSIFAFEGDDGQATELHETAAEHGDWSGLMEQSDLVMVPAACYPVYPAIAARGPLPDGGTTVDAGGSYVFRHEPSGDPARLQMFHQHEMVRIGSPEAVQAWRDAWRDRAVELLGALGLDPRPDVASDPFFGRAGRLLARSQKAQALKWEILVEITEPEPTAVASFNYHQEHFAGTYGIVQADGEPAHTACLGFGHERIVIALLRRHGLDPEAWPGAVREELWPA